MKYLLIITIFIASLVNAESKKEEIRQFMIKTKITEEGNLLSAPSVITQVNNEAIIRIVTEKYLPKNWDIDTETMLPKPSFDNPTDFGFIQKVTIKELKKDGQKLTLLHGELVLRSEENTPELTVEKPDSSSKDSLFFQTEKKSAFCLRYDI